MLDLTEIGSRIRKCRELQGFTREDFSEKINVSPRFVYDIELGNKGMSVDTLISIRNVLNVSIDFLLLRIESDEIPVSPDLFSLIQKCPDEKKEYLTAVIQNFILAVQ